MKTIQYNPNRKKNPSHGLSARDYAFNNDLDFYQDTSKYCDKFRDALEDTPVTRVYDLIWRGDLGGFPKFYFDNITKNRKCEQLLYYVYRYLYIFSKNELITMSHRQFLSDIKLSYIHTSGLFPNYKEIIAKVLEFNISFLKGKKHLDVSNRRKKLSSSIQLKLTKEISSLPNKKKSSKSIIESLYKDSGYKLLGQAGKDQSDLGRY